MLIEQKSYKALFPYKKYDTKDFTLLDNLPISNPQNFYFMLSHHLSNLVKRSKKSQENKILFLISKLLFLINRLKITLINS